MPSKKGGGRSFGPISMMMKFLYYPVYWFLWVVVDLVGTQKLPGSKRLMQVKWVKDIVKFCKEFRYVCCDHFSMPGGPSDTKRCKVCFNKAAFWCVDCGKKFCPQCTLNAHSPNTLTDTHSIEELTESWSREGVHIVSPILPEMMFVLFLSVVVGRVQLFSEDYLTRADLCPAVTQGRQVFAALDPHLFYYFKGHFASWCNGEDSFWKLMTDAWVRGIVTDTDSTLLVFMNFPQAMLFEVVMVLLMVPVISVLYAVLLCVVWQIELQLPRTPGLTRLEAFTSLFHVTTFLGSSQAALADMDKKAPDTKWRRRPAMDFMDAFYYGLNRKLKLFRYFYNTTCASLKTFVGQVTMWLVCFRLGCIWLGLGGHVRKLLASLGASGTIETHREWFEAAAGRMLLSEAHMWQAASTLPGLAGGLIGMAPDSFVQTATTMAKVWTVLYVVIAVALFAFCYVIVQQRREFWKQWAAGARDVALNLSAPCEEEQNKQMGLKRRSSLFGIFGA